MGVSGLSKENCVKARLSSKTCLLDSIWLAQCSKFQCSWLAETRPLSAYRHWKKLFVDAKSSMKLFAPQRCDSSDLSRDLNAKSGGSHKANNTKVDRSKRPAYLGFFFVGEADFVALVVS